MAYDKGIEPIDRHVGSRIHLRRVIVGMSQASLGEAIGVSFQQVQKYETAANRVSASKLYAIANVLGVDVSFFFDDIQDLPDDVPRKRKINDDPMASSTVIELVIGFNKLKKEMRLAVFNLVKHAARYE